MVLCDGAKGGDRGAGREIQEGENVCLHEPDSLSFTAEINTTLQSTYTPIIKALKKKTLSPKNLCGSVSLLIKWGTVTTVKVK